MQPLAKFPSKCRVDVRKPRLTPGLEGFSSERRSEKCGTLQVYKCSPSGKLKNRTETGKNNVRCHLSAPKFGLTGGVPCFAAEWITKVCSIIFIFFLHRLHLILHAFGAAAGEITTKPLRQRQTLECQRESTKPGRVGFFFFYFTVGCSQL